METQREEVHRDRGRDLDAASLLIVRSSHIQWDGVHALLREWPGVEIVAEVMQPEEAVQAARQHHPTGILAAADAPGISIAALARQLLQASPQSKIMVFMDATHHEMRAALEEGACSFIVWSDVTPVALRYCLGTVLEAGLQVVSPAAMRRLLEEGDPDWKLQDADLTDRERAVLRGLVTGLSLEAISIEESLSRATMGRTIAELKRKLAAPTLPLLIARAMELGFGPERA